MPAQPKHNTLARLLELLKSLPHHRWATAQELRDQLAQRGYVIDLRTVQRDLKELQASFPIDHNDKGSPHGWRWSEQAAEGIAGMSTPEALMLVLVQQYLQAALPATMLEGFETLFMRARQRLDRLGPRAGATRWPKKVKAVTPGLPTLSPTVDVEVQKGLADALLADRQIDAIYAPGSNGAPKSYRLHPIGLILRGGTTYLVATAGGAAAPRLFALHRFRSVDVRLEPVALAPGLDLERALKNGRAQFGIASQDAAPIKLVMACTPVAANLLAESPIATGQALRKLPDGRTEVRAEVDHTWELRWWLTSRGADIEVLAPASLRAEIANTHRIAAARYEA